MMNSERPAGFFVASFSNPIPEAKIQDCARDIFALIPVDVFSNLCSPFSWWNLSIVQKLRFWKISCTYRHNVCDRALSARPNSASPAFHSPLRSEDFASSWWFFRKSQASPLKKKHGWSSCENWAKVSFQSNISKKYFWNTTLWVDMGWHGHLRWQHITTCRRLMSMRTRTIKCEFGWSRENQNRIQKQENETVNQRRIQK